MEENRESTLKVLAIPSELCRRAGMGGTWASLNELGLYPGQSMKTHIRDKPSSYAPGDASVFMFRQEVILFHPILRKLVNESNGTFLNLQTLIANKSIEVHTDLLSLSREYRSVIRACLENLQEERLHLKENEKDEYQAYITIFYSVECIWHLCEILFVDFKAGQTILSQLLNWVRFHFPSHERNAAILLSSELSNIDSQPNYWKTVIGTLMQGQIEVARTLLQLHSASKSNPFRLVDQILKNMPLYHILNGIFTTEFQLKWKHWLVDTQSKIDAKLFISEPNLDFLMRLVIGEETAWSQAMSFCETWYELLPAWLLYTEPMVKSYELGKFAKLCIQRMEGKDEMRHLDKVLLATMEFDVMEVIKEIQQMSENGWFVTHLTDLLYHCGKLRELDKLEKEREISSRLREFFVLEYGTLMMGHESLWTVGLSYLDNCPKVGLHTINLLLPRVHLRSEMQINRILREAQKRKLLHICRSICKTQAVYSYKRDRWGAALSWALKAQDGPYVSFLADMYLKEYLKSGKLKDVDLLNSLGSSMLASDRLIFLGKYCEFHRVYESRDYKQAALQIVDLIKSKITPTFFWPTLLVDALPLLECDELVLTTSNTVVLMQALEERRKIPELKDKTELLRLALVRNLSRALIYEAQLS